MTDGYQTEKTRQLGRFGWARHVLDAYSFWPFVNRSGPSLCDYRAIKINFGIFTALL